MKYRNASDVLPEALLKEVQKYASGETLYFPKARSKKKWGEQSGARAYYRERNRLIRERHLKHASIERIAEEFGLSADTIRKIIFSKAEWEE